MGPSGAAWCPRCYLPYHRTESTTVSSGRHRTVTPPPPPPAATASWGARVLGAVVVVLLGWGLYAGIQHGVACRVSVVHPNRKVVEADVRTQLAVVQTLATGAGKSWTLQDGAKVIAADAALTRTVAPLQLSDADHVALTSYLVAVHTFDAALTSYMAKNDDPSHAVYGSAAVSLQKAADNLSDALASTPSHCRIN
ncbi:hypothetical protein acdb102_32290 [Acidothermaceae bacterium B102]|nr:hypothetical protein acdb102_32290 [Acidothermaceae bacterium B102]